MRKLDEELSLHIQRRSDVTAKSTALYLPLADNGL
jgi:hypothetical protein